MEKFKKVFNTSNPVIGVIHVQALPGTPNYKDSVKNIIEKAKEEAAIYKNSGVDAIMIENMHDVPYVKKHVGPEITSMMSIIGYEIKNLTGLPCGVQILAGANKEALAAAHASGLDFIRTEGFVFAHVADEGIMESDAGELLRYRKQIDAENILIFTDVKKKHSSHTITSDVNLIETAKAAEFFQSDGVIITGYSTGEEADTSDVKKVKDSINIPVFVGSGITEKNLDNFYNICDGFIVGSYFKKEGYWKNDLDIDRIDKFIKKLRTFR